MNQYFLKSPRKMQIFLWLLKMMGAVIGVTIFPVYVYVCVNITGAARNPDGHWSTQAQAISIIAILIPVFLLFTLIFLNTTGKRVICPTLISK